MAARELLAEGAGQPPRRRVRVNVRRLGPGDEDVVRALAEREPQTELLTDERTLFLAAFDDSTPIGFVLAYVLQRRHGDQEHLFVYEIGVRADVRRSGVGTALMQRLAGLARERGLRDAFLLTNESNAAAMAFYAAIGGVRPNADDVLWDLRVPVEDGQKIQILTTSDKDDPDALSVLRHSTAHLLAEAVRRLYPGVKIAIGPPIANGFYYDFEFPEPISEVDLERIEAEMQKELAEGREWNREEVSREEARRRFEAEGEPYKVELVETADGEISFYTQGDFTDLCRGPHLQNSKPIKAAKLTGRAGADWRGDEVKKQLTLI